MRMVIAAVLLVGCGVDVSAKRHGTNQWMIRAETRDEDEDVFEATHAKAAKLCPNGYDVVDESGATVRRRKERASLLVQCR